LESAELHYAAGRSDMDSDNKEYSQVELGLMCTKEYSLSMNPRYSKVEHPFTASSRFGLTISTIKVVVHNDAVSKNKRSTALYYCWKDVDCRV